LKKTFIALLFMACLASAARAGDYFIRLDKCGAALENRAFYVSDVVNLAGGENIGTAYVGLPNKPSPIKLYGGLSAAFRNYFNSALPASDGKTPVTVFVIKCRSGEVLLAKEEKAKTMVELSFCLADGGRVGEIYRTQSYKTTSKHWDVTKYHRKNLKDALDECLSGFSKLKWKKEDLAFADRNIYEDSLRQGHKSAGQPAVADGLSGLRFRAGVKTTYQHILAGPGYNSVYTSDTMQFTVPRIISNPGLGLILEIDPRNIFARLPIVEAGLIRQNYWAFGGNNSYNVDYTLTDLNIFIPLNRGAEKYAYAILGTYGDNLTVNNGAHNNITAQTGDAFIDNGGIFNGSYNIGIGYTSRLQENKAFSLSLVYRTGQLKEVRAFFQDGRLKDPIRVNSLQLSFNFMIN
jgi:hypothetical protein